MTSVTIKVRNNSDLRRIQISRSSTFESLQQLFSQLYKIDNFVIKYLDDEEDFITISSDEELVEAFRLTKEGSILRMTMTSGNESICNSNLSSSSLFSSTIVEQTSPINNNNNNKEASSIVNDITQLSEHIAEKSRKASMEISKKGEYLANQASHKTEELGNQAADTCIQLATISVGIGEELRKKDIPAINRIGRTNYRDT